MTPSGFSKHMPVPIPAQLPPQAEPRRSITSDVFMRVEDIQMTGVIGSANVTASSVVDKRPLRHAARKGGFYRNFAKRALDISLVVLCLPAILPLILVLAAIVAWQGGSPFYRQQRIGLKGRVFHMWKLRSMVRDADQVLEQCLDSSPALRAEWTTKQKLINDPRVTSLGRFLRKSSLDELPQLWNVLRGEMALVGPRPMTPEQAPIYPGRAYFAVRPGLT
ncbi:MAG: sugar transferase, partial [Pseudomonadota bacterium]